MLRVNIVGIGPGNPELLTNQARQAIEESNILICLLYTSPSPRDRG